MILYAFLVRTDDGLPLSASTDFGGDVSYNVKESNRYMKMIANRVSNLPDYCTLNLREHCIFLVSSCGVSCIVLTDYSYSSTLAFSFLNDVLLEFRSKYDSFRVNTVKRPYPFMEFDSTIHKMRQKYNNPVGLPSRVNLIEISDRLKMRPPHNLSLTDIEPLRNGFRNIPKLGVGSPAKLEPLAWYAMLSIIPAVVLALLDILRCLSSFQWSTLEDYDGPDPVYSLMFLVEGIVWIFQIYLLLYYTRYREAESWFCVAAKFACIFMLWDLRSVDQNIVFIGITLYLHVCTITRRLKEKPPDYNV